MKLHRPSDVVAMEVLRVMQEKWLEPIIGQGLEQWGAPSSGMFMSTPVHFRCQVFALGVSVVNIMRMS